MRLYDVENEKCFVRNEFRAEVSLLFLVKTIFEMKSYGGEFSIGYGVEM